MQYYTLWIHRHSDGIVRALVISLVLAACGYCAWLYFGTIRAAAPDGDIIVREQTAARERILDRARLRAVEATLDARQSRPAPHIARDIFVPLPTENLPESALRGTMAGSNQ